jgi:hypothetical protein
MAWPTDLTAVVVLVCGSGGLGVLITWVYHAKRLRQANKQLDLQIEQLDLLRQQLAQQRRLNELALGKSRVDACAPSRIRVSFLSDKSFADKLMADALVARGEIFVKRWQSEKDPAALQLGFSDPTSISSEITNASLREGLAQKLLDWARESNSNVIIRMPFNSFEIDKNNPEDEVRQLLVDGVAPMAGDSRAN